MHIRFATFEGSDNHCDFIIPDWALAPLVNGDYSALTDEEEEKLNSFVDKTTKELGNAHFMMDDEESSSLGFRWRNDIDGPVGGECHRMFVIPSNASESVIMKASKPKHDITKSKKSLAAMVEPLIAKMDKLPLQELKIEFANILTDEEMHASEETRKKWMNTVKNALSKNSLMHAITNLYLKAANMGLHEGVVDYAVGDTVGNDVDGFDWKVVKIEGNLVTVQNIRTGEKKERMWFENMYKSRHGKTNESGKFESDVFNILGHELVIAHVHDNVYRVIDRRSRTWNLVSGVDLDDAYKKAEDLVRVVFAKGRPDFYPRSGTKYMVTGLRYDSDSGKMVKNDSIYFKTGTHWKNPRGTGEAFAKKGDILTFDREGEDDGYWFINDSKENCKGPLLWSLLWSNRIVKL